MQTLIKKNKALLVKYTAMQDDYHIKLHTTIAQLLKDKKTLLTMNVDDVLGVLYDLGYDYDSAIAEYERLMAKNVN